MSDDWLIVDGPAPHILPAFPLPFDEREDRNLFAITRNILLDGQPIWKGYVTDFGSIPWFARWRIRPLDRHAWACLGHDVRYAIGEPGKRAVADERFLRRMLMDGVAQPRRTIMHQAVRLGGAGGYARAKDWWDTENFVDLDTGARIAAPFPRELAFDGQPYGLRRPDT